MTDSPQGEMQRSSTVQHVEREGNSESGKIIMCYVEVLIMLLRS